MRCKACDAIMAEWEMVIRPETGEFEDLCLVCRKASQDDDDIELEIEAEFALLLEQYGHGDRGWDD